MVRLLQTTFVFVTTIRWAGKKEWVAQRQVEKNWKDVRALDASDLEQWLEQSIPAQVWFFNETHAPSKGTSAIRSYWKTWSADCEPALVHSLFSEALKGDAAQKIAKKLKASETATISADSRGEGLAFPDVAVATDAALSLRPHWVWRAPTMRKPIKHAVTHDRCIHCMGTTVVCGVPVCVA